VAMPDRPVRNPHVRGYRSAPVPHSDQSSPHQYRPSSYLGPYHIGQFGNPYR
jgi:hypothetical protein